MLTKGCLLLSIAVVVNCFGGHNASAGVGCSVDDALQKNVAAAECGLSAECMIPHLSQLSASCLACIGTAGRGCFDVKEGAVGIERRILPFVLLFVAHENKDKISKEAEKFLPDELKAVIREVDAFASKGIDWVDENIKQGLLELGKELGDAAAAVAKEAVEKLEEVAVAGLEAMGDFVDMLEDFADKVTKFVEDLKNIIMDLKCNLLDPAIFEEIFSSVTSSVTGLANGLFPNPATFIEDIARNPQGTTCKTAWDFFEKSQFVLWQKIKTVGLLAKKCPLIFDPDNLPAITFGFQLSGALGVRAGIEIGLGYNGKDKFCYIGGCAMAGIGAGSTTGVAGFKGSLEVTLWRSMSNVPGKASMGYISMDLIFFNFEATVFTNDWDDVLKPSCYKKGANCGVTGLAFSLGVGTGLLGGSAGGGMCYTPLCFTTEGQDCDASNPTSDAVKKIYSQPALALEMNNQATESKEYWLKEKAYEAAMLTCTGNPCKIMVSDGMGYCTSHDSKIYTWGESGSKQDCINACMREGDCTMATWKLDGALCFRYSGNKCHPDITSWEQLGQEYKKCPTCGRFDSNYYTYRKETLTRWHM